MRTMPETGTIFGPPPPQPVRPTTATRAAPAVRRARPAKAEDMAETFRSVGGGHLATADGGEGPVQRDVHVLPQEGDAAMGRGEVGPAGVAAHERAVPERPAVVVGDAGARRRVDRVLGRPQAVGVAGAD